MEKDTKVAEEKPKYRRAQKFAKLIKKGRNELEIENKLLKKNLEVLNIIKRSIIHKENHNK